jgi:pyruvate/2-oxoglutarate/acetoin dehydrogenase E1 component
MRVLEQLNQSLHAVMAERSDVLFIGEDVLDPYGGAFKVSKGLSTAFPDQVITTPISEASIVGLGTGLALQGYRPVVEIMFGDFITLIADQLVNQAAKMTWMYNRELAVPIVVRTPMGGRRGYGPTHSQTLEKHFLGVPGLTVLAASQALDAGALLRIAIEEIDTPVLFVENKLLYARQAIEPGELDMRKSDAQVPTLTIGGGRPDFSIITYGDNLSLVLEAVAYLHEEEELNGEILMVHQVSPIDFEPLRVSVMTTRRVVVVEEGIEAHGWGAEVIAGLSDISLEAPPERVGARSLPIPAARGLEEQVLPQKQDVIDAVIRTVDRYHV